MKSKLGFVFFLFCLLSAFSADNYTQWLHYKDVKINTTASGANVANPVTKFPLLVRLTNINFNAFGSSGVKASIRFANGSSHLPYQVERWDSTGGNVAEIWVLVDTVYGNDSTHSIRMYWGNSSAGDSSNGGAVFSSANGYVGAWHLGDAAGIGARPNAVAGAPAATPSNDAGSFGGGAGTYVAPTGVIGKADVLRGGGTTGTPTAASDYLNIGTGTADPSSFIGSNTFTGYNDFSTGFTYSVWVNPGTPTGNYSYLLELANTQNADNNIQLFRPTQTTTYRYEHCTGGTSDGTKSTATGTLVEGTWQHIVVTVGTGATPAVTIYKNGAVSLASSNETGATNNILRSNTWIGKSNYSTDAYWVGSFDEPEISNVTRSADWIKLSYQSQVTGSSILSFGTQVDAPPSNLTYAPNPAVYTVNFAIPNNSPTLSSVATHYSVAPALPAGLLLDTTTGIISGTPTITAAAANYTITASSTAGSTTATLNITVNAALVAPSGLTYSASTAVYGLNKVITNNTPVVTGTVTNYVVNPGLPAGLSLNAATGVISGTPTSASAATNYVMTASNSAGSVTATLNITVPAAPSTLSYSTPTATYPMGIAIANNSPTVTGTVSSYSVSPALPAGLTLNTATGVISGTPTAVAAAASYTVTATNISGSATAAVNITVFGPPTGLAYTVSVGTYTINQAITADVATVATGPVTKFTISPALPRGLNIDSVTGTISGTPLDTTTTYITFTITASNAAGSTTFTYYANVAKAASSIQLLPPNSFVVQFSGASNISFVMPLAARKIQLSIVDAWGRTIWSQKVEGVQQGEVRKVPWNGTSNEGLPFATGVYVARAQTWDANGHPAEVFEKKIRYVP